MKLIIAGSRGITDRSVVEEAFEESGFEWDDVELLIHGDAKGVDSIGCEMAEERDIETRKFDPAEYKEEAPHPKVAPLLRNTAMADAGDALLAVWDGESNGTADMKRKAAKKGLTVVVHRTDTRSLSDFI